MYSTVATSCTHLQGGNQGGGGGGSEKADELNEVLVRAAPSL